MKRRAVDLLILAAIALAGITALVTLTRFTDDGAWLVILCVIALTKWLLFVSGSRRRAESKERIYEPA